MARIPHSGSCREGRVSVEKPGVAPTIFRQEDYLVPSPILEDGGHKIGRLPSEISDEALRALGGPESPGRAIRAKCVDCSGGSATEARKCVAYKGKSDDADLTSAPELEGATP